MSQLSVQLLDPCVDRSLSVYLLMRENVHWRHLWLHYFGLNEEDYTRFVTFLDALSNAHVMTNYIQLWHCNLVHHPGEKDRLFASFVNIFHCKNNALLKLMSSNNAQGYLYQPWDFTTSKRVGCVGFGFITMTQRAPSSRILNLDMHLPVHDKFGLCPLLDYRDTLNQLIEEILLEQTSLEEEWTSIERVNHIQYVLQVPAVLVGTIMQYLPNVKICYYKRNTKNLAQLHTRV